MKRILFLSLFLFVLSNLSAQENFHWELIDSTAKSKDQIYTSTKVFIAEAWRSAQDVIQNDDKDGGVIIVKGVSIQKIEYMMGTYRYEYRYTASFQMKDNKFRMILKDVYCANADMPSSTSGMGIVKVEPFEGDNAPASGTFKAPGPPKKKLIPMMANLKQELQQIVDSYKISIAESDIVDDDW